MNRDDLKYLNAIVEYLAFKLETGKAIKISDLAKEETRGKFIAAVKYIHDRDLLLLHGERIKFLDKNQDSIIKVKLSQLPNINEYKELIGNP